MKYRLVDLICCPDCLGSLEVESFTQVATKKQKLNIESVVCTEKCSRLTLPLEQILPEHCIKCYEVDIEFGKLVCSGCRAEYPIINGVPRLLPRHLLAQSLVRYHEDFVGRYSNRFSSLPLDINNNEKMKLKTLHAFSYQWTTFIDNFDYFKDIFLSFVNPYLKPEDFDKKLVLEAGCGSGRPASVACSFGAEVVGVDLSEAVATAYQLSNHYSMLHIVQADIYKLPFKSKFDFVYSVGVIQHLPDPALAIKSISKVVHPGSKLYLWVYGIREFWYQPIEWLRKFTTKLPFRMLHFLSILLALLSELFLLLPYRILSKIKITSRLAEKIPGNIYAKFPFRENVVGWFDRLGAPVTFYFSKDNVEVMLKEAGFYLVNVVARPGASASWVAEATKKENLVD